MTCRLLAVTSLKGGCGKSTISALVAGVLAGRANHVLLVDGDFQGTAMQCCAAAPAHRPFPAAAISLAEAKGKLHQLVRPHTNTYDYIVIDTPPSIEHEVTQSAMLVADVCLVPFEPSPANLWSLPGTVELVRRIRRVNPELTAFAVANRVSSTRLASEVLKTMEGGDAQLLNAKLRNRVSFQEAMLRGCIPSAMGASHRAAALESEQLVDEILTKMEWK